MDLTILLTAGSLGLFYLFLFCYFGKLATESFEKMADYAYEINWHELPIEQKKYFILIIANTQKPLLYHGFSVVKGD